ncbi:MAG TPA: hypothetical protein VKA21_07130 [Candidatus Binatia bacterium]|nr:hypothetical protein [Candidatus Binatia bacterium]
MARWLVVFAVLAGAAASDAAVLCAKRRAGGSVRGVVKARDVCRADEVTLTPEEVGFCCTSTTTPTTSTTTATGPSGTTTTSSSEPCPTTTTLGVPSCAGSPTEFCSFLACPGGQTCGDGGSGQCTCTGPFHCGGADNFCGGDCAVGLSCQQIVVPEGCPSIGCECR